MARLILIHRRDENVDNRVIPPKRGNTSLTSSTKVPKAKLPKPTKPGELPTLVISLTRPTMATQPRLEGDLPPARPAV
jgi:hypothetical protein